MNLKHVLSSVLVPAAVGAALIVSPLVANAASYAKRSRPRTSVPAPRLLPRTPHKARTNIKAVSTTGVAKVTLSGVVLASSPDSVTVRIAAVSPTARTFKGQDVTLAVAQKTKITNKGQKLPAAQLPRGSKVKVFGTYDRKAPKPSVKPRWIKVVR